MAIELRQVVRTPSRREDLGRLGFVLLFLLSVAAFLTHPALGYAVFVAGAMWLLFASAPRRPDLTHELPAFLGKDGLRHAHGFVPRASMRVFEVTRDAVRIATYEGDRFELHGSTKALADAKRLARTPHERTRDEDLEALVLRVAERPRVAGVTAYRAGETLAPEAALAVATDPRCPPKVRVAAAALLEEAGRPEVRLRIEEAAEETAHPEVHEALRAAVER